MERCHLDVLVRVPHGSRQFINTNGARCVVLICVCCLVNRIERRFDSSWMDACRCERNTPHVVPYACQCLDLQHSLPDPASCLELF